MSPETPSFLARVWRRLVLEKIGYGRPVSAAAVDGEYRTGAWAHFHALPELPRQSVIAGWVSQLHPGGSVLDVGCGSGRLAQLLQPHRCLRYLGVDLSSEGVRAAQALQLPGCEFQQGNFETWRPSEPFDAIIFSECIGYANDPGQLVAAFLPWLKPQGTVVISHFRYGAWEAHWRRVERHVTPFASTTLTNEQGQTWDLKLLCPPAAN